MTAEETTYGIWSSKPGSWVSLQKVRLQNPDVALTDREGLQEVADALNVRGSGYVLCIRSFPSSDLPPCWWCHSAPCDCEEPIWNLRKEGGFWVYSLGHKRSWFHARYKSLAGFDFNTLERMPRGSEAGPRKKRGMPAQEAPVQDYCTNDAADTARMYNAMHAAMNRCNFLPCDKMAMGAYCSERCAEYDAEYDKTQTPRAALRLGSHPDERAFVEQRCKEAGEAVIRRWHALKAEPCEGDIAHFTHREK